MTGGVDNVSMQTLYDDAQTLALEKVQEVTTRLGEIPNRTYVRHGQVPALRQTTQPPRGIGNLIDFEAVRERWRQVQPSVEYHLHQASHATAGRDEGHTLPTRPLGTPGL
jgi:hypothetical protein